ncbi:MAG TPA: hypothetical protein VGS97_11875, partial [Actinocrinis sp.]|uniref:FMN-binding protein n=1 Tax=Actinocrinis sp. TaxID=1920516 RepID=UPI002DDD8694
MRRAIVTGTATVSGVVLLLGLKSHGGGAHGMPQSFSIGPSADAAAPGGTPTAASTAASTVAPHAGGSTATARAASGTKTSTGDAADTPYGPVQVQVTLSGGKITNIKVLEYPTETGRDQEINGYALPILNQEAMTAQSASIDAVSG